MKAIPETLAETAIRTFAEQWYGLLDEHAPVAQLMPLLANDALEMVFPEGKLCGIKDFEEWYDLVCRKYFDETHTIKDFKTAITDDTATVQILVEWKASMWTPPAAYSQRISVDAGQTWTMHRCGITGKPLIARYAVDSFDYHAGSARI